MLSSSSFDSNFFTVPAISPSYKPLSLTLFFSELQTPKKKLYKNPPKKIRNFSELSGLKQLTHISFGKAYKTDRILKARSGIDFCKLKKTPNHCFKLSRSFFWAFDKEFSARGKFQPPKEGIHLSELSICTHAHTHTEFATSKQTSLFTKNQTKLVTQSKHACPLAQKHTPNPKRLLSTQSKRQEAPPRDELHRIQKMSFSCLPVGAQQMHNTKPSNKHANP